MEPYDSIIQKALFENDDLKGLKMLRRPVDELANQCRRSARNSDNFLHLKKQMEDFGNNLLKRLEFHRIKYGYSGKAQKSAQIGFWWKMMDSIFTEYRLLLSENPKESLNIIISKKDMIIGELIPAWALKIQRAMESGDAHQAESIRSFAQSIAKEIGETAERRFEAEMKWLDGLKELNDGDPERAKQLFSESTQLLELPFLYKYLLRRYREIGDLYYRKHEKGRALQEYEQGVVSSELIRAKTEFNFRMELSKILQPLYWQAIKVSYEQGDYNRCLIFIEMSKARSMIDMFGIKQARDKMPMGFSKTVSELCPDHFSEIQALLSEHDLKLMENIRKHDGRKDLFELEYKITQAYRELMKEYYAQVPFISILPGHIAKVIENRFVIDSLLKNIPEKAVVMQYFVTNQEIIILLLSRQGIIKAEGFQISKKFSAACREVLNTNDQPSGYRKDLLFYLYKYLIGCIEDAIPEDTELIYFSPHSYLNCIPLHILLKKDSVIPEKPLIWFYDIAYTPSLSFLEFVFSARSSEPGAGSVEHSALVVGNPDTGNPSFNLPGAEAEAQEIATILDVQPYLKEQVTREVFFSESKKKDIISISCHARPNILNPLAGYLMLSDAPLRVIDIMNMDLSTSLLILSGCSTHVDFLRPGDEALGLTQAFFYSGVRTIVSSMWEAHDIAARELMVHFFTHYLKDGMNKARSLRLAQLEVMSSSFFREPTKKSYFSRPYFWAPFILVGDYR